MCAIAGVLYPQDGDQAFGQVQRMVQVQRHRGPDGSGVSRSPHGILGHARLSIIDLNPRSAQPMSGLGGRLLLAFNGEIYNHAELRRELRDGYPFQTDSDTEVILAAYAAWGPGCLERLNGMFAFCLLDVETGRALIARDRFGQKPLYYATQGPSLLFASEVKALLAAGVPARANMKYWADYLGHGRFDHLPETPFAGVRQLPPGCFAITHPGGSCDLRVDRYYDLATRLASRGAPGAVDEGEVRERIVSTVALHTCADVPVGISLSGGLDSSALVAALDASGCLSEKENAFSVVFPPEFSEEQWMKRVAEEHGLSLHLDSYTPEAFASSLAPMMWHLEGPIGGLMNCGLSSVVRSARRHGCIVLLSGMGLDEVFGGYRNMHAAHVRSLLAANPQEGRAALGDYARAYQVSVGDAEREVASLASPGTSAIDGTIPTNASVLSRSVLEMACDDPGGGGDVRGELVDYLQRTKIPRNMRMMDRLSMAFGIEYRSPFLDHHLVEFGLGLPLDCYFRGGLTKAIVRHALQDDGCREVMFAPKRNVQTPQGAWLRKEPMRSLVRCIIESESFASRGLFDVRATLDAFDGFQNRGAANSFFVWQWLNVELWFRTFIDRDAVQSQGTLEWDPVPERAVVRT